MKINTIHVTGTRESEAKSKLFDKLKTDDLVFTPVQLMEQFYIGKKPYEDFLKEHNLGNNNISNQTKTDNIETALAQYNKILNLAKSPFNFKPEFSNLNITKVISNSDILMEHTYNLSEFSQNEFDEISNRFKKEFKSSTPLAYLNIFDKKINVIESFKTLYMPNFDELDKKGAKNLMSAISFRDRENIVSGINKNVLNYDKFNFNMNTELQLLNKIVRETLKLSDANYQTVYKMNNWDKAFFENDLYGANENENTLQAKQIIEMSNTINKEQQADRQGSISPNIIKDIVNNRDQSQLPPRKLYTDEAMDGVFRGQKPKEDNQIIPIDNEALSQKTKKIDTLDILDDIDKIKSLLNEANFAKKDALMKNYQDKLTYCYNNSEALEKEYFDLMNETGDIYRAKELLTQRYANNDFLDSFITNSINTKIQLSSKTEKLLELTENKILFLENEINTKNNDIKIIENKLSNSITQAETKEKATREELDKIYSRVELIVEDQKATSAENIKLKQYILELEKLTENQAGDLELINSDKDKLINDNKTLENANKNLSDTILIIRENSLKIQEVQNNKIQEILEAKDKQSEELFKSINTIRKLENMIQNIEKSIEPKTEILNKDVSPQNLHEQTLDTIHEDYIDLDKKTNLQVNQRDNTDDIENMLDTLFAEEHIMTEQITEEQDFQLDTHKKVQRMR